MAAEDGKLKLLPRHLQRSQPASSSKSKRRVTVEDDNAADEESDRRSVFERLGPGGLQRSEKPRLDYGQSLKGRGKNDGEKSPDSLRLKFKGSKDREAKVRSQVVPLVVKKADGAGSDEDSDQESDNWSIDNLEDKKERELEQKRQEIQRALKALEDGDDAPVIDTKKSDSSGSDSSPERMHKKKKDKQGKKKEKKKHKKGASEKEMSLERQGKRKHGSDEEEASPHKKKKKKNKERKHADDVPPPSHMPQEIRKQQAPKPSKAEPHLYEPDSPTSTHRSDSPEEKAKGKKRKKKGKAQVEAAPQGKSKKLLSPLKKVLKLKKGPASVGSSKRSRSESRDSGKRKQSRSSSSSSSGSSSESPVPKRRERDPSADDRRERGRVKSKSLERKRKRKQPVSQQQHQHPSPRQHHHQQQHHHHRSASSSSSSSSSTNSSTARGMDHRHSKRQDSRSRRLDEHQAGHQQQQRHKKSRSPAVAAPGRKDGRVSKRKRDASAESWNRSKDKKGPGRGESPQRPHRQGLAAGNEMVDRGRQRNRNMPQEEVKGHRALSQQQGRHRNDSKDRGVSQPGSKDRLRRGADASHDRNQKDGRDREKEDRKGRKDESRERVGVLGGQGKERDRMDERGRRIGGAGGGPPAQQAERGGRMIPRRGNSADRDRRNFGGGDNSGRMGQFPRQDMDRGPMSGRMGHNWDDRDGRRDVGGDWDSGREVRSFGGHREDMMGGGKRRDGGREERMLPHPGRGGPVRSGSQDRLLPRGHGQREEFGGGMDRGRDRRGGSQEADAGRRDRDGFRGGRDDSRGGRGGGGRDEGGKPRGADRDPKLGNDDFMKDRDVRERDLSRSDRVKASGGGRGGAGGVSPTPSGSRIVSRLRGELAKEDSPGMMRGESSLAAVFDQTETTRAGSMGAAGKKRPTKSFGGKKSPKKPSDDVKNAEDKSRLRVRGKGGGLSSRDRMLGGDGRGGALPDADKGSSQTASKKVTPSRDFRKEDGRAIVKQEIVSKERASPSSQKSADSRHSHSKSSKRSSRSPQDGRQDAGSGGGRAHDSVPTALKKSPHKKSESPGGASPLPAGPDYSHHYDKDKDTTSGGGDAVRGKKKEDTKGGDATRARDQEKGTSKGRSQTPSDADSKTSPDLHERMRRKSSDSIESLPAKLDGGDIAAAMLGDGPEEGQQDVFSDWSDDDDAFATIIDDGPRKRYVEDLDDAHGFDFAPRGHGHHDPRGRHGSPAIADQAPGLGPMMHHGMGPMEHPGAGHPDAPGLARGRDFHHPHHHGGAGGRYFGGNSDMPPGGGHMEDGSAGGGGGGHRGQMGPGRVDHNGSGVDELTAKPALEKNIPDVKIVEDVQKEKPARERRRRNTGEEGYEEISSDENDLDEEGERIPKRTIVSILDIDMSSLVQIAKPSRPLSPSVSSGPAVFQRFKACSVFSQLGLSRRLAGEELFARVQEVCQKQVEQEQGTDPTETELKEENHEKPAVNSSSASLVKPMVNSNNLNPSTVTPTSQPNTTTSSSSASALASSSSTSVKSETISSANSSSNLPVQDSSEPKVDLKETLMADTTKPATDSAVPVEPSSSSDPGKQGLDIPKASLTTKSEATAGSPGKLVPVKKPQFKLYGDSPADHIMKKARAQDRSSLLSNFGLFRRALTARKDLDIRRQLCKIDSKYDQSAIYPAGLVDPDTFRMSLQLMRQKKAAMMAATKVS